MNNPVCNFGSHYLHSAHPPFNVLLPVRTVQKQQLNANVCLMVLTGQQHPTLFKHRRHDAVRTLTILGRVMSLYSYLANSYWDVKKKVFPLKISLVKSN
jgi:hypothetical protein